MQAGWASWRQCAGLGAAGFLRREETAAAGLDVEAATQRLLPRGCSEMEGTLHRNRLEEAGGSPGPLTLLPVTPQAEAPGEVWSSQLFGVFA